MMGIDEILEYLPHRYPFLLVDRVTEVEKGKSIKGYKNVPVNEPFFQGHFPNNPIMPGGLIIAARAQLSGMLGLVTVGRKHADGRGTILSWIQQGTLQAACVAGRPTLHGVRTDFRQTGHIQIRMSRTGRRRSRVRGRDSDR